MTENPERHEVVPQEPGVADHAAPEDPYDPEASPPIEADLQPRPEPVLEAARLGGLLAAVVVAVASVVSLVLAGRWTDINALGTVLGGLAGALMALIAYIAPVWQARKARAKVTPLADPRDIAGRKLVPARHAR
jgi:Flp pilus assembly pilin Flp